jgi:hypothetical protein
VASFLITKPSEIKPGEHPLTSIKVNEDFMNERNQHVIRRFADKVAKMQKGIKDDLVGDTIPYLSGTRTGFAMKSKTYRDKVLDSITKHLPKEETPRVEDTARSSGSTVRAVVPPSVKALR